MRPAHLFELALGKQPGSGEDEGTWDAMWNPSKTLPQNEDCDSVNDLLRNMLDEERHWEIVLGACFCLSMLVLLASICFILGLKVKPRPPSYWTHRPWSPFTDDFQGEVDVTEALGEAVQALFDMTTKKDAMGLGRDGKWATHKAFRVLKVTRVENGKMWTDYANLRKHIDPIGKTLLKMPKGLQQHTQAALDSILSEQASRRLGPAKALLNSLSLDADRNEVLMFHGSPGAGARDASGGIVFPTEDCSPVFAIKTGGFDDRLGSVKGMYGSGTYFADMVSKADQYGGQYNPPGAGSVGEVATLFLSRVTLGCPYATDQSLEQLRRPPCIEGHFDLNLLWNEDVKFGRPWKEKGCEFRLCSHHRFDSVMGDWVIDGQKKMYREFVVYEKQCYPEFCVTYRRVA
eukprot:TRINITY_DN45288_c0_g1_i1.p1 TRINITY_DN45288_c0_g1~~TRINITY_DN45288_c0_g1_i1.p1  ORF type:complete len:403 (-),score=76.81 TRINITY_DN45288_c0_g1_i1:462-1670(-)